MKWYQAAMIMLFSCASTKCVSCVNQYRVPNSLTDASDTKEDSSFDHCRSRLQEAK